ncbi:MAG: hypothetical protein ACTS6G_04355 [Candidatus Hodgkinia cicadicola]
MLPSGSGIVKVKFRLLETHFANEVNPSEEVVLFDGPSSSVWGSFDQSALRITNEPMTFECLKEPVNENISR